MNIKNFLQSKQLVEFLVLLIFVATTFLRFYGNNWDQGFHLHPDERMITMVAEKISLPKPLTVKNLLNPASNLNPKFFPYGSFPIYLLKFSGWIAANEDKDFLTYTKMNLVGRSISALADVLVMLLIYLIGKNIWSRNVGRLACLFYGLSVFPMQLAHFYAVDTLLNFFIALTLYRLLILYDHPTQRNAVYVGISYGLALATKVSATVLLIAIGTALLIDLLLVFIKRIRQIRIAGRVSKEFIDFILWIISASQTPKRRRLLVLLMQILKLGTIICAVAVCVFLLFEPYAIIDFPTFWKQTLEQQQMTKSAFTFPYTLQYVGTTPYLYHVKNLLLWGMGIPLGSLSLFATFWILYRLAIEIPRPGRENQEAKMLILVFFFLAYFLVVGRFAVKFMRYLLPLYGLLCLFSACFTFNFFSQSRKIVTKIGKAMLMIVVLTTFLWSIAFVSIYIKKNTRTQASEWILRNIPQGETIAVEHWDDRVPLVGNYRFLEMPMYEPDNSELKWLQMQSILDHAHYLVLASNRLYVPLQKLGNCEKYPEKCYVKTAEYYSKLFSGNLGFKKIAEFTSYPMLGFGKWKLIIDDSGADESFTVYDHPKVIVFQKKIQNNYIYQNQIK